MTLDISLALTLHVATSVPLPLEWQNVTLLLTICQKCVGFPPIPHSRLFHGFIPFYWWIMTEIDIFRVSSFIFEDCIFLYSYANMLYFADIFAQFIYPLHEMIILFHEMISVKAHFVPNFAVVKHQRYAQCRTSKLCYGICHVVSGASAQDGGCFG